MFGLMLGELLILEVAEGKGFVGQATNNPEERPTNFRGVPAWELVPIKLRPSVWSHRAHLRPVMPTQDTRSPGFPKQANGVWWATFFIGDPESPLLLPSFVRTYSWREYASDIAEVTTGTTGAMSTENM